LNAVLGFSEVLAMETFGPLGHTRYREYVKDIHGSGAHLLTLINDILDLTKLDSGTTALDEGECDIADMINTPVRMVEGNASRGDVKIACEIEPSLPRLRADKRRVQQVLINLLSNAVKFTPASGNILVRAFRTADEIGISVKDTGIGMSPADIPKALELFDQIDNSLSRKYEGAGLGLPLARRLIELHGGRLVLESTLNVGTTATVFIPWTRIVVSGVTEAAA
jgi:signal transduction histidine kinase